MEWKGLGEIMPNYGYTETQREVMQDTFAAEKFKEIQRMSETPTFEELLLGARDKFLEDCTYDELEKETLELMGD